MNFVTARLNNIKISCCWAVEYRIIEKTWRLKYGVGMV